jgi:uncharacterized protein YggE
MTELRLALAVAAFAIPAAAGAQVIIPVAPPISGTRLDLVATGEVIRVPDLVTISGGVTTQAATAAEAISQNATRMERVRAAIKSAGIVDRDIQTTSISLSPQYKYGDNQSPLLTGYQASNQLSVRLHDVRSSGRILDAMVAAGTNQLSGPTLSIERPEDALGMRVMRVISVSESGGYAAPTPMPMMTMARVQRSEAKTSIDPGEQQLQITVAMTFELK